jgi:predicted small lipoprotein YifL
MVVMGSAARILVSLALVLTIGLSGCGRRGSLERPEARYPEVAADPSTKQSEAPDRRIPILDDIIH